ncbi:endonuclease [Tenacibaculum geojense]|uniref:Endonuclease n=1 Tax=Tenacibaculum geojense TaxID=915352 RepID=A0ABW3JR09_9FLAO
MKKTLLFIALLACFNVFAQIPSYYNNVNLNLSGNSLKNELATKIISTHTTNLSYTPGVWEALKQTDLDPNNPSKVLLIYGYSDSDGNYVTDRSRSKDANGGTAGSQWNREHVYPKSLGNPNLGTSGAGSDAHSLRAADISFNSQRSSKKFADGSGNAGNVSGGWYPGDEWKGDVARMMMYMYLRYGSQCLPTGVGVGSTVASDNNMLLLFLEWNAEDPVSEFEKQRNPILENLQGNRNPFIDNPAFATEIWGGPQAEDLFGNGGGSSDTQAPSTPTNLVASNITQTTLTLNWNASSDNVAVSGYNVYRGSTLLGNVTGTSANISSLTAGTNYTFNVRAFDAAGNISNNSNTVSVTTSSASGGGSGANELFISEYVEGSSNNKAIEIANFTGNTVNLSGYSLRKATNGSGSFSSVLNLSGSIANGQVYVIAYSSASTTVKNNADLVTSNSALTFNGNDAVALYKNTTLIDVVGNPNSSSNFAKDKTLQRKSSVNSPNTSYVSSEWNVLNQNTFSGLGSHSVDGGSSGGGDSTPPPTSYCSSKGNNASYEWIDNVVLGGISNATGNNGGYANFTSKVGNLSYGSNTIVVSAGFSSSSYTEFWKVWIDFNKNGIFESSEQVVSGSSSSSGNLSYTFSVPTSASSGLTRMRVSMKWDAAQTACETFSYGEVEDYTVNIGGTAKNSNTNDIKIDGKLGNEPKLFAADVYPNPARNFINIQLKDNRTATYRIMNVIGQTVKRGNLERTVDVSNLNNGMYILEVNDGQRKIHSKFLKK